MIVLWLLLGIIAVSVAFFIPSNSTEVWPELNLAGLVTAVYLLVLLLYTLRKPISTKKRVVTWVLAAVVMTSIVLSWTGIERTSKWQRGQLLKIHSVIIRGIACAEVPDTLLDILAQYHNQSRGQRLSIGGIFRKNCPDATVGYNIHKPDGDWDSLKVFVTALSETEVVMTAHHPYSRGRDPSFVSYTGRKGAIQERFILTEKGVRHESDN